MLADLVREIRRDPDDDEPRLVAADWYATVDAARGEYIAMALRGLDVADALLAQHGRAWSRPLIELGARPRHDVLPFHRGFVEEIALYGDAARAFDRMCELEPILEVLVSDPDPALGTYAELALVRDLTLMTAAPRLIASPHLTAIESLAFPLEFARADAAMLAASVMRPKRIQCTLDPAIARILAASNVLDNLEEIERRAITSSTLEELAAAPLAKLRKLSIRPELPPFAGIDALGARLDQLDTLSYGSPPGVLVDRLIRHMPSGRLRRASFLGYDDDALIAFLESPACRNLEELAIGGYAMSDDMAAALERLAARGTLRRLVSHRPVTT